MNTSFDLYTRLYESEVNFKKACDQVILLNDKLEGLQKRYDKAREENHRSFRYNLRLRMATVEGVRNAYYEYACDKAERIAELRHLVAHLQVGSESNSEPDSDDSYEGLGSTFDGTELLSDPELDATEIY